ncbi:MAG: hypothetical protein WC580_05675 [Agrococcus sp.]
MARRWQVIRVELLSGRGDDLEQPPGRMFICPSGTTFAALGHAIDLAFARWDLSHLCQFELADGTLVVDAESQQDLQSSPFGAVRRTVLLSSRVKQHVAVGDRFEYLFDFGDSWVHACEVTGLEDPDEKLGIVPDVPLPFWGWGDMPDQYGRRWEVDDGESEPPVRGAAVDGAPPPAPLVDLRAWRAAVRADSADGALAALSGADPDLALQQIGTGLLRLARSSSAAEPLAPTIVSVLRRLQMRDWEGDDLLAADLLATVRGEELPGIVLAVDLEDVADTAGHHYEGWSGGYLNKRTGETVIAWLADADEADVDEPIDVESDDWVYLQMEGTRWDDMADFAERMSEGDARRDLQRALEGKGAFSRFRRAVDEADLGDVWHAMDVDRALGRARALLRDKGISPV